MKFTKKFSTLLSLALIGVLSLAAPKAEAQTNTNSTPPSFFQTAEGYFTSFNTNLTTTFDVSKHLEIWTGAEQNLGTTTAADLGAEFTAIRFASNSLSLSVESVVKNAGVAGTILAVQGGLGLSYTHVDAKLTVYVDGGEDFLNARPYCEIGARAKKALTENTYMGLGISLPIEQQFTGRPNLVIFTGFTF